MSKYEGVKELTKIEFKYPLKESIESPQEIQGNPTSRFLI